MRARRPAPRPHAPVRLRFVGDVQLGTRPAGPEPFREALAPLGPADLLVANLEGPLAQEGPPAFPDKPCFYRTDPAGAEVLRAAGVDVVSLANNHVLDRGVAGLAETRAALLGAGIRAFGAGRDAREATAGAVFDLGGLRVGLLGFMETWPVYEERYRAYAERMHPGVARLARAVVRPAAAALRRRVDLLVASVHWGREHGDVTVTQRTWARQLAEAGFDLVVGHHPHVVQGVEVVGRTTVLFSLGNFVFAEPMAYEAADAELRHGFVADVRVEEGRVTDVSLVPFAVDGPAAPHAPRAVPADRLPSIAARVQRGLDGDRLAAFDGRLRVALPPA